MEVWARWTKRGEREYPEFIAAILNSDVDKGILGYLAGIPLPIPRFQSAPFEVRDKAVSEFICTLRTLTCQWIATGKLQETERGEEPWERSVNVSTPDYPQPILNTLIEYRDRNPPKVFITDDGRFGIPSDPMIRYSGWPSPPPELEATLQRARDFAICEFAKLLESHGRERLFRCDECGKYLVRARAPRKETPIYHGTFCEKCKHKGSARRTVESRKRRTQKMIEWAADAWEKWTPGNRFGKRADWVVEKVNAKLPAGRIPIKINWVTKHQTEIEAEVERRNYGARKN